LLEATSNEGNESTSQIALTLTGEPETPRSLIHLFMFSLSPARTTLSGMQKTTRATINYTNYIQRQDRETDTRERESLSCGKLIYICL